MIREHVRNCQIPSSYDGILQYALDLATFNRPIMEDTSLIMDHTKFVKSIKLVFWHDTYGSSFQADYKSALHLSSVITELQSRVAVG